jgi:DNA mismatch repair protein MutS
MSTPLMQQYQEIKSRHQDAILFFRMGEFYEMFYDDAEVASRTLGLTLTSRNNGGAADVPLAGVPVKAASDYVRRLVQQGFRVAICEQLEDPSVAKGIVKRDVIETITPGAALVDDLLDGTRNNFLCALLLDDKNPARAGLAAADVSTGEFRLASASVSELEPLFARYAPREVLVSSAHASALPAAGTNAELLVTQREAWEFDSAMAAEELIRHFGVHSLEGLGISQEDALATGAAGALLRYLKELQPAGIALTRPVVDRPEGVLPLDEMTRRNLELVESLRGSASVTTVGGSVARSAGTLLDVLDRTVTPMGARLLRQWLLAPLASVDGINARLDAVACFVGSALAREQLRTHLGSVRDVERLGTKAALGRINPREMVALGTSLERLPAVRDTLSDATARAAGGALLADCLRGWDRGDDLAGDIARTIRRDAPPLLGDEPVIADGVDAELDTLRSLRDGGRDAIARIQSEERERTGIQSLKVGFNKVFGYYIEITKSNLHNVPAEYQRRQTIANGERFITPALKDYEERVLTATERIESRERELFDTLRRRVGACVDRLHAMARMLATIDVLASLAEVAAREGYARPEVTTEFTLRIVGGRHPVVERMMPRDKFVPNDVDLTEDARIIILTGPNMAGKSTILRQIGLIALMAHVGSFVPATRARIGLLDRLFTRVGASDNLARGQSTFMVEMSETSAILHTATARSLVLLDEIGRGTSTYDGVSIAWAVTEHLHETTKCKTVFATHYHELTQLADELKALRNYNVAVREARDRVVFTHRMEPGGADRSYGIDVARLAGLPPAVIERARGQLRVLEAEQLLAPGTRAAPAADSQLALFHAQRQAVVERLAALDVNGLTPVQALALRDELARESRA